MPNTHQEVSQSFVDFQQRVEAMRQVMSTACPSTPVQIPPNADGQRSTVSIDGVMLSHLTRVVYVQHHPSGHITEHVHHGMVTLGDGTITDDVSQTAWCDLCRNEAEQAVMNGLMTMEAAFLSTRHLPRNIAHSADSGRQLCRRHQATFITDNGVPVIVSHEEAAQLEALRRGGCR